MRYKRFITVAILTFFIFGTLLFLKSSSEATAFIWNISGGGTRLLPLVTISALIDSINPCAFSILLLTIAFLFNLGALRKGILKIGMAYIFGIFTAYLFIGLGILHALHLFNTPHFMGKLGAVLLIALGILNLINEFFPSFPIKLQIPRAVHGKIADLMEKSSVPAVFALGVLVGICEFPCTGGPYLMVIGLLHDQQTYLKGFGYLLWYNVLFVAPLALILLLASERMLLQKVESWRKSNLKKVKVLAGLIMVAIGILIFFI